MIKGRILDISKTGFPAVTPLELPLGETATAEIHRPFGTKTAEGVARTGQVFGADSNFGTDLSEEIHQMH